MKAGRAARYIIQAFLWIAVACSSSSLALASETSPCAIEKHAGQTYSICTFDLRRYELKLFWRDGDGKAYGSVAGLVDGLIRARQTPIFAMNAGMYHPDLSPVGLFVANGAQMKTANTSNGSGNFQLKPNGVFYLQGSEAGILETGTYLKHGLKADLATQSGPMLVINGQLHPRFSPEGQSRKIRNGVGVRDSHTVVFAISSDGVTFTEFAELFRQQLRCSNALFLDGSISSMYAPSINRADAPLPAGPIIAAFERMAASH